MEEIINKSMNEVWDPEFLEELNNYAMKINEHNLIDAIKIFGKKCLDVAKKAPGDKS